MYIYIYTYKPEYTLSESLNKQFSRDEIAGVSLCVQQSRDMQRLGTVKRGEMVGIQLEYEPQRYTNLIKCGDLKDTMAQN